MSQLHEHSRLDSTQSSQQTEHTQNIPVLDQPAIVTHSGPPQSADHLDNDVTELFQKYSKGKHIPLLFSIECSPYCDSFTQSPAHLPVQYQSLFDSEHLKVNYLDLVVAKNEK